MTWFIIHKPAYDIDFVDLPKNLQKQATQAHVELADDPTTPRGRTIKPLKGWKNLWRYRLGDYRLIYSVEIESHVVQLLAIGPRKDIYRRFKYAPEADRLPEIVFGPELTASLEPTHQVPEWMKHPEWYKPKETSTTLPRKLTPSLLRRWRIPLEHHDALLSCKTEDDLLRCEAPQKSVERVLEHLYPRPAEQVAGQPDLQLMEPEDLLRYAEGDLLGFLLRLDSEQDRYVDWALDGPTLVKGGPGSGKSTVALYRARELVERGAGTVLFTTYTNALVEFSRQLLKQVVGDLPATIKVDTLDSLAVQVVENSDRCHLNIGGSNEIKAALNDAQVYFWQGPGNKYEKMLLTGGVQSIRKDYLVEEIEWVIEGRNLRSAEEYLETDRVGRGYGFDERTRRAMWRIYQHVQRFLEDRRIVTWGYVRSHALELVRSGKWPKRWDAVIVDEAQDLTPTALALCIELCHDPTRLFLTADASQSLYNRGFRWKNVHAELRIVGRTRILRKNYRSTRQIAEAAAEILRDTGAGDEEVLDQIYIHSGPRPVIHVCGSNDEQLLCLAVEIQEAARELRLPVSAVAVLTPTHQLAEETAKALNEWGLPARYMTSRELDLQCPRIKVLTIHSAKGLEFPIVAMPFVEDSVLPRPLEHAQAEDLEQHLSAERRLFFVGCTRAMRRLFVACRKDHRSPFLDDLSRDAWRWE
jgi:superfamily I DNA/RNA helicase/mRNA-degrading endonuclease RelE of RelBE toxin-antitoxin system